MGLPVGVYIAAHISTMVVLVGLIVFQILDTASVKESTHHGLFEFSFDKIWEGFFMHAAPSTKAYYVLFVMVMIYQFLWQLYNISSICRSSKTLQRLCYQPGLISLPAIGIYNLGVLAYLGWLFFFDKRYMEVAIGILFLSFALLWVACGLTAIHMYRNWSGFTRIDRLLIRVLVLNGIACFATWTTILAQLNIGFLFSYIRPGWDQQISSGIVLIIIGTVLMLFMLLDLFVRNFNIVIISPYVVFLVYLIAAFLRDPALRFPNVIVNLALLVTLLILIAMRIFIQIRWPTDACFVKRH